MAATLDQLRFLAPSLDGVSDEDAQAALDFAADYVPSCLTGSAADKAQLYYAAWLLTDRLRQQNNAEAGTLGGVKSWKEGDISVTFSAGASGESSDGIYDPGGWYARWKNLARICGGGSITVSRGGHGCGCAS